MGVIALSQVVLVAFAIGFFIGHFTGSDKVVTVTAQQVKNEELKEAQEEEEAPALAEARIEKEKAEKEGEEKAAEVAKQTKEEEAEAKNGEGEEPEETAGTGEEAGTAAGGGAMAAAGKEVFTSNCGTCHTLSEAGTTGEVGPNLDQLMPEKSLVETQVTNGGGGMPPFGGQLSEEEIQDVATYVSEVAGT